MTLNLPHLQQVLDWLEAPHPYHTLDMSMHHCGTACCISGYVAVDLAGHEDHRDLDYDTIAAEYLGLPPSITYGFQPLFYPDIGCKWSDITPAMAAQATRNVMAGNPPGWAEIMA